MAAFPGDTTLLGVEKMASYGFNDPTGIIMLTPPAMSCSRGLTQRHAAIARVGSTHGPSIGHNPGAMFMRL